MYITKIDTYRLRNDQVQTYVKICQCDPAVQIIARSHAKTALNTFCPSKTKLAFRFIFSLLEGVKFSGVGNQLGGYLP